MPRERRHMSRAGVPARDDYPHQKHLSTREVATILGIGPKAIRWLYVNYLNTGKLGPYSLPGYDTAGVALFHPEDVLKVLRLRAKAGRHDFVFRLIPSRENEWRDVQNCPHCGGSLKGQLRLLKDGQHQLVCKKCTLPLTVDRETEVRVRTTISLDKERLRAWRQRQGLLRTGKATPPKEDGADLAGEPE